MQPRKKPTPSPIARAAAVRPLAPARTRSVLPTVAALLALSAIGCEQKTEIRRDDRIGESMHMPGPVPAEIAEPSLGVVEDAPVPPPPPRPAPPTKKVHPRPSPTSPPMPGGLMAVHPTI